MSDSAQNQLKSFVRLEDRLAPALFGQTWVNPNSLTYSIAPDGTDVDGQPSAVSTVLGKTMSESVWTGQIREAFQTWSNVAGFDITARGDAGRPFGSDTEALQNSFWNGDIRIAARPLSDNVLAITNPPDMISPWAGEIVLNSNVRFSADGANGTYQLYTVMLQEIGHSLGLNNNANDMTSVMYESYQGVRSGLAASDISGIQGLYGARTNDSFEGKKGNETTSTATPLTYVNSFDDIDNGEVVDGKTYIARAVLTAGETDTYKVTVPNGRSNATIHFVPMSLVRGRMQIYDSSDFLIGEATGNSSSSTIMKSLSNLGEGKTYTVKITAETGSKFSVGSYRIAVGESFSVSATLANTIVTTIYSDDAKGIALPEDTGKAAASNDTRSSATDLGKARETADARWDVNATGRFHTANDVDFYKIQTKSKTSTVMHVAVWAASTSTTTGFAPVVEVFDSKGNRLTVTTLRNSSNTHVIQVIGINNNTTYFVSIRAASFGTDTKAKSYNFGIDFRSTAISLNMAGQGTLTETSPELSRTIQVNRSTLFRFELTATSQVGDLNAFARITIRNQAGSIVFSMDASSGETIGGDVLLNTGLYQVQISGLTTDGRLVNKLDYVLQFTTLTDPIGPRLMTSSDVSTSGSTTTVPTAPPPSPVSPPAPTSTTPSETGTTIEYVWGQTWYVDPVIGFAW